MGVLCWLKGEMQTARGFLEEAERECRRLGLVRDRASALGNLGSLLFEIGDYAEAIPAIRQTIELQESLNDLSRVAINCGNLAECYLNLGALEPAEVLIQRAYSLATLIDAPALTIEPERLLGLIHAARGETDEALEHITTARQLAEHYQRGYLRDQALLSLAEALLQRGEIDQTEATVAELLARPEGEEHYRAAARLILGRCMLARGDSRQALVILEQGLLDAQRPE
jgi:tetratricopeptide (TPR) repeat protein